MGRLDKENNIKTAIELDIIDLQKQIENLTKKINRYIVKMISRLNSPVTQEKVENMFKDLEDTEPDIEI